MTHVARREYELNCNWKVFCDNYLDGGYHVPFAHPELASGGEHEELRDDDTRFAFAANRDGGGGGGDGPRCVLYTGPHTTASAW